MVEFIKISSASAPQVPATCDWGGDEYSLFLQGGKAFGFTRNDKKSLYFVELIDNTPECESFFRAEAETITEAEIIVWKKWIATKLCLQHEWETKGYTNGAGVCGKCNFFRSNIFPAEELGQFCSTCGTPTYYHQETSTPNRLWFCESHVHEGYRFEFDYIEEGIKNGSFTPQKIMELELTRRILIYRLQP